VSFIFSLRFLYLSFHFYSFDSNRNATTSTIANPADSPRASRRPSPTFPTAIDSKLRPAPAPITRAATLALARRRRRGCATDTGTRPTSPASRSNRKRIRMLLLQAEGMRPSGPDDYPNQIWHHRPPLCGWGWWSCASSTAAVDTDLVPIAPSAKTRPCSVSIVLFKIVNRNIYCIKNGLYIYFRLILWP